MASSDDKRYGVLNDWDLACVRTEGDSGHVGGERTGTVPFMAIGLLNDNYWLGRIERRYWHDLEGLIWVLPWVFLQFNDGNLEDRKLREWQTGDFNLCRDRKLGFLLQHMPVILPMNSWKEEWTLAVQLLRWVRDEYYKRVKQAEEEDAPSHNLVSTPSAIANAEEESYNGFRKILGRAREKYGPLGQLLVDLQMTS